MFFIILPMRLGVDPRLRFESDSIPPDGARAQLRE